MRGIKERAGLLRGDIPHPDGHPSAGVLPSRSYHPEEQINNRYARTRWNDFGTQIAQARYGGGNANKGYDITLESIIAAGGFGIAALVRHRSTRDWVRKLCVMKVERSKFRDKPYMDQEEMALKGAKHIVQYLDRTQEIKNQRDAENAEKRAYIPRKTTEEMDKSWDIKQQRDRRFIIVEYAEGGNLDQWLAKSSRSGKPWPNKALWLLFKCLVKGLIGMGYPPKKIYADDPNFDPNHPVDETIPKEGFAMENTAHFDLDPLNILVAKDEEHGDMPIFKIADFGNAVFFDDQEKTPEKFTKEAFWRYRYRGKTHTLAPEQFDKSWDSMLDFIDDISPNQFVAKDGSKPSVAGNYGMHTNVYQIGLIMWCAITRSWFESPVVAAWYPDYNRASGFRTYGASLQSKRFTKVDEALKIIIQRCMAHNPADRPPLDALKKIIDSRLKLNGLESDEEVSNWAKEFFDSPRCPGDEVDPPTRRWKRTRPHDEDDEEYWRASQRLKTEHEDDVQPDPKLHIPRVPLDSRVAQFPVAGFQPGGPMYQQPMPQQAQQQAPEGFQPRAPAR
ncbi:hypothetical protein CPLU01_10089 [Colletotrichum plurivorum]|uniref:non-specific serine/threonine protein kinase n=1 Tax=Colletotrichum plurivorum TaxID=2175906 RepID=A0A8H6K6C7_9PEZI|nr:hypothetical protein CPLU01_10089 [Colletotrichum plurivorum]